MYSLFLFTATLAALGAPRAVDRGRRETGRSGSSPCSQPSQRTRTACSCSAPTGCSFSSPIASASAPRCSRSPPCSCSASRSGSPTSCSPGASTSASAGAVHNSARLARLAGTSWWVAGDLAAGWNWVLLPVLAVAVVGLFSLRRETVAFAAAIAIAPVAAFLGAHLGSTASPQTRHLIFVLPFFAMTVAAGLLRLGRRRPCSSRWPSPRSWSRKRMDEAPDAATGHRRDTRAQSSRDTRRRRGSRPRRDPTTSCSATSRSTWAPGSATTASPGRSSRGPTPCWRSARSSALTASDERCSSSTGATPTT